MGPEGRGWLKSGWGQRGERPRRRRGAGGGSWGLGCALRRVCKAASLIKREFIEETPERRLRQRGRQRYLYRAALVRSGAGGAALGAAGSGPEGSADRSPPSLSFSPPPRCVPQDFCTDLAVSSANFVPTVTAISTSPDLQWLVQPTLISSVAPSQNRGHPYGVPAPAPPAAYSRPAVLKAPGGRGQSIGRRGKVEQVSGARG